MRLIETTLHGLALIEPVVHGDERGFFLESWRADLFPELGVRETWVQDNHSRSARGVLRGLHFQVGDGQAKLVRCARGSIVDAVVDIRRGSPTYGRWEAVELDERTMRTLYVPIGFAHGFCVTSDVADVVYRCSSYYAPDLERTVRYDDPDLAVGWPPGPHTVSARDRAAPRLAEVADSVPFEWAAEGMRG